MINGLLTRAKTLLRSHDGELTRTLSRTDGGFGLGQVPERVKPDAATTMVCSQRAMGNGVAATTAPAVSAAASSSAEPATKSRSRGQPARASRPATHTSSATPTAITR